MTDACKACHENFRALRKAALRFAPIASLLALGLVAGVSAARADTAPVCRESGMPIETLGSDKRAQAYEAIGQKAQALDDFRAALEGVKASTAS